LTKIKRASLQRTLSDAAARLITRKPRNSTRPTARTFAEQQIRIFLHRSASSARIQRALRNGRALARGDLGFTPAPVTSAEIN